MGVEAWDIPDRRLEPDDGIKLPDDPILLYHELPFDYVYPLFNDAIRDSTSFIARLAKAHHDGSRNAAWLVLDEIAEYCADTPDCEQQWIWLYGDEHHV